MAWVREGSESRDATIYDLECAVFNNDKLWHTKKEPSVKRNTIESPLAERTFGIDDSLCHHMVAPIDEKK